MTVTVDLINDQAINLLRDMERLNLLRVKDPMEDEAPLSKHFCVPTEEEARSWREPLIKNDTRLREILEAAAEKAKARKKDPFLGSLQRWHGVLKNSKAWGKDVDVVAKIRAMRDEWDDPWEKSPEETGKSE